MRFLLFNVAVIAAFAYLLVDAGRLSLTVSGVTRSLPTPTGSLQPRADAIRALATAPTLPVRSAVETAAPRPAVEVPVAAVAAEPVETENAPAPKATPAADATTLQAEAEAEAAAAAEPETDRAKIVPSEQIDRARSAVLVPAEPQPAALAPMPKPTPQPATVDAATRYADLLLPQVDPRVRRNRTAVLDFEAPATIPPESAPQAPVLVAEAEPADVSTTQAPPSGEPASPVARPMPAQAEPPVSPPNPRVEAILAQASASAGDDSARQRELLLLAQEMETFAWQTTDR